MILALALCGLALGACSTIGDPGGVAEAYPHGGTGQFRVLEPEETGVRGGAISLQDTTLGASMVAGGYLFYAAAPLLEEPPVVPMDHPEGEVYWPAFEPRTIHRAEPRELRGFYPGPEVLAASEPWEGDAVFDPWVVIDEDGGARMYYAAEGGIGLATAASVDGAFQRASSEPILDADDAVAGAPRRPSVIRGTDGAWWMYYDAGGAIGIARSEDGATFERVDGDPSTEAIDPMVIAGEDLGDSVEVSIGMPGAAALDTPVGRRLVRVYYESRREDGTVLPYVAGSADGVAFERHEIPIMEDTDIRAPAPLLLDARVTLLYALEPDVEMVDDRPYVTLGLFAAASPASQRFEPPEQDE